MAKETKNHCVYEYKHKTNKKKVYYIGQRNKPNVARIHKVNGIHPSKFTIKILHKNLTQKQANKLEKLEIEKHNCIWSNGFNRTSGGKTTYKTAEITKKKLRKIHNSPEVHKKHSVAAKKGWDGNTKRKKEQGKRAAKLGKTFLGSNNPNYGNGAKISGNKNPMKRPEIAAKHRVPKPGTAKAMRKNNPMKRPEIAAKHRVPKPGTAKAMRKNNPMKRPEIAIKISQNNLKKAKQRLIKQIKENHLRIRRTKKSIQRIENHIKELKLLIS